MAQIKMATTKVATNQNGYEQNSHVKVQHGHTDIPDSHHHMAVTDQHRYYKTTKQSAKLTHLYLRSVIKVEMYMLS